MTILLDALALAAVVAAVAHLWHSRRRPHCGSTAAKPAQTRVSLESLRASARRAAGRQ